MNWTDEDAGDWTWHLCRVREPARARRELTGVLSGGTIGLADPESIRFKPAVAVIFEPTEVRTVPVKNPLGQVVRNPGSNRAKLKHIQKPLFPGYWFAAPVPGADWQAVDHTDGVLGVIRVAGDVGQPWAARAGLMHLFFEREKKVLIRASARALGHGENFRVDQSVIITNGPFADFNAVVSSVDKSGRVALLIAAFGRHSTVYVDATDLVAA